MAVLGVQTASRRLALDLPSDASSPSLSPNRLTCSNWPKRRTFICYLDHPIASAIFIIFLLSVYLPTVHAFMIDVTRFLDAIHSGRRDPPQKKTLSTHGLTSTAAAAAARMLTGKCAHRLQHFFASTVSLVSRASP